ncbi:EamA-like transporter family protein [Pasteurella testudinis DSM 23072]|uniref:EamA-like transporter family protein n=1 Tax=Pasteurella testudinis DSM 23072 TaxID=1122938 RepID=A0A1W1V3Q9_9PAST|nr:DMT family transporter [Pasteurella testudinis]SMB87681.1 EamA-like transporter family protein [Pasteurella testudinis DSM 23072]SUB50465.1 Predicted permease, DMT superfamily [Pasteurella testudinis]
MTNLGKGVLAMLISALGFTVMAVCVKLAGDLPVVEKAIFRNAIAALLSGYLVWRNRTLFFGRRKNRKALLLRSIFGLLGVLLGFYSIDHLLLSDADMIMKLSPFILIGLSAVFLQENVSVRQIALCILAFIGVLLIIRPGLSSGTQQTALFPYLIAIGGAVFAAAAYLMLRVLALSTTPESPYTIVFFFSFFSTIALIPPLIWQFEPMSFTQFGYLLLSGVMATVGQFGITLAYRYASAKEVSIYSYASVIFAALFGITLFGQLPDLLNWLGYLLIFISGYLMFLLNRKAA